jgi:S1-C subfamily serine protease
LPSLGPDAWPAHLPPPRLGISWRGDEAEPGTVCLTRVVAGTPAAAAGLEVLDRIGAVNGQPFADEDSFRAAILELIDTGTSRFTLLVETRGRLRTLIINLPASEATLQSRKISRDGNPNMGTPSTGGKPRI